MSIKIKRNYYQQGFTLAEVTIAMVVAVLVGGLLLAIIVSHSGLFDVQSKRVRQGLGLNDALAHLRDSIKMTRAVALEYPVGTPTYTTSASQLVLKLPSIDSSGNVITNTYDYAVYTTVQNNLRELIFPDALSSRISIDQVLTGNVKSIVFDYFDTNNQVVAPTSAVKIRATITLQERTGINLETNTATTEAFLRNS